MSKEVKRYDPYGYDGLSAIMREEELGDYVSHEDYDALLTERDALKRAQQWISVEDGLPMPAEGLIESDNVIVCLDNSVRAVGFYCHAEQDWYGEDGFTFYDEVTHWMPLPAPPDLQGEQP